VRYEVFGEPASALTVDGRAPARTILDRDRPSDWRYALRMLAFDVPAGRPAALRVRQRFELAAGNVLDADLADHLPLDVAIAVDGEVEI
jgi:hypothetical protein